MRVPWLADVLRSSGCVVVEAPGWKGRGRDLTAVNGVVAHHTASGPRTSDDAVVRLLIEGRSDLKGPLCQLGLDRRGRFHVIADGKGNHNGYGQWGNQSIGIEAFNDGIGERWPDVQVDAYKVGVAAILAHLHLPATAVKGHKETDPGRKIDPAGIDMGGFRLAVARLMAQPIGGPPPPGQEALIVNDQDKDTIRRIIREELAPVKRGIMYDEASDKTDWGSLRGWLFAIAAKVGATREEAVANDPTHRKS